MCTGDNNVVMSSDDTRGSCKILRQGICFVSSASSVRFIVQSLSSLKRDSNVN